MDSDSIEEIFKIFNQNDPSPKTELKYINDYTLLVSIVLSAQATDISVNKATKELFTIVQTPENMISLGEEKLREYIKSIGLYNAKAKNIIKLSEILVREFSSKVPNNYNDLIKLPGVGSKTAKVLLNCAYDHPTIAVDTHVFRVSNRLGLINAKTIAQAEIDLEKIIPKKWQISAHHWLILHGRYICRARKPECDKCMISNYCEYKLNQLKTISFK